MTRYEMMAEYQLVCMVRKIKEEMRRRYGERLDLIEYPELKRLLEDKEVKQMEKENKNKKEELKVGDPRINSYGCIETPRSLIEAIVQVMKPEPGQIICDPCCGRGGFLIAAHDYILKHHPDLDADELKHLKYDALVGFDISDRAVEKCIKNFQYHGIHGHIEVADSLALNDRERFDMILAHPPFIRKAGLKYALYGSSSTSTDICLCFLERVQTLLRTDGKCAIILPDYIFENQSAELARKHLFAHCNVHTRVKLPTGSFMLGTTVKPNILFFNKKLGGSESKNLLTYETYDLRDEMDLDGFVKCYEARRQNK